MLLAKYADFNLALRPDSLKIACRIYFSFQFSAWPIECSTYYGPHDVDCLQRIWLNVGCLERGFGAPANLDKFQLENLGRLNYRYLKK